MLDDPLTLLRVGTMLVFIAAFAGIVVWLLRPGAGRRGRDNAMIPLREDGDPGDGSIGGRP